MILNTAWLCDYLSPRPALAELLPAIIKVGLDVEKVLVLRKELAPVKIGFVRSKETLTGTSDMFVLQVQVGPSDIRQIICASEHPVEVGWGVPVALSGTELPTGLKVDEKHLHGVLSQGMVSLDGELGLVARSTGVQVFLDEATMGQRLVDVSPVDEALVHLKVTPNRPDCLGLIGIAREVAAVLGISLVLPDSPVPPPTDGCAAIPAEIEEPALSSRYTCQRLSGVQIARSPAWLHSRLLSIGSKPINNVVDITNFVLHEWGHPLHAFDATRLNDKIVVRRMRAGEELEILNGAKIKGETRSLVIADAQVPVALAGIMGGRSSAITPSTTEVVLESAHFEPANIRRTARDLDISTDASYRFERGMDPNETLEAARRRAASLIVNLSQARAVSAVSDAYPVPVVPPVFSLTPQRVSGYLGFPVSQEVIHSSLVSLGYQCSPDLQRIVPPTRRVDANDPVVLIEDVGRMVGYESIPAAPSAEVASRAHTTSLDDTRGVVRQFLVGHGFYEIKGYPLEAVGATLFSQFEAPVITLINPKVPEESALRQSLIPALLSAAARNATRNAQTFRYFEIDKVFVGSPDGPVERWAVGLVSGGTREEFAWSDRRVSDFYDLKGVLEELLELLRQTGVKFAPEDRSGYSAGRSARLLLNGQPIGTLGQIDEAITRDRNIQSSLFAAELLLEPLVEVSVERPVFRPVPRYQAAFRDLSVVVGKSVLYADIEDLIHRSAGPDLESVTCVDVFEGGSIPRDLRSLTVSMVFRSAQGTLVAEQVNDTMQRVAEILKDTYQAQLRA